MKSKTEGKKSFLFSRKVGIFGTNCIFFFFASVLPLIHGHGPRPSAL